MEAKKIYRNKDKIKAHGTETIQWKNIENMHVAIRTKEQLQNYHRSPHKQKAIQFNSKEKNKKKTLERNREKKTAS